jgi:hypothetical protein
VNGKKYSAQKYLSDLLTNFPLFSGDLPALESEGIIERITPYTFKWTKSKTSLAEYFRWIGNDVSDVPGGFWNPVESVFTLRDGISIKRGSLAKLAGHNANPLKPDESKDFQKIKILVERYRKQEQKDRKTLAAIKTLIYKYEKGIYEYEYDEDGDIIEMDIINTSASNASKVLEEIKTVLA